MRSVSVVLLVRQVLAVSGGKTAMGRSKTPRSGSEVLFVNRRTFLRNTALALPALALQRTALAQPRSVAACPKHAWHEEIILRSADLLCLRVRVWNFRRNGNSLVRIGADRAFITVEYPPQHIQEQAFEVG